MKYALLIDNSVQWFTYLVALSETGECVGHHSVPNNLHNDYLANFWSVPVTFNNLRLSIPNYGSSETWCGYWISEYDYSRLKRLIELHPQVEEYQRLGKLEKL